MQTNINVYQGPEQMVTRSDQTPGGNLQAQIYLMASGDITPEFGVIPTYNAPIWIADPISFDDRKGAILCPRTGLMVPERMKTTVNGISYLNRAAPRDSPKEHL